MLHNFDPAFEQNHNYETEYIKVLYYDLKENHKEIYHSYHYNRLCTILKGTKHIKVNDGSEFDYSTSDFILLPPNSSVDMEIKEPTIAVVYEISDKLIDDTHKKIQLNYDVDIPKDNKFVQKRLLNEISSPIDRIHEICMGKDPNRGFLVDLYAQELIYDLLKRKYLSSKEPSKDDITAYTVSKIMANLYNSQFTIREVAAVLNVSQSTLVNTFKKQTGYTPKEYQNIVKLKTSVQLLKEKSVTEVSYDLGFENISYFIKLFKSYYGLTPKQYTMKYFQRND